MSADVALKAGRLLRTGRVTVLAVDLDQVLADVDGDSGRYQVAWRSDTGRWTCTCPARGDCSHVLAVKLITRVAGAGR